MTFHHPDAEDALEQATFGLFSALGWEVVNAYAETFPASLLGREHAGEVVLLSRLRPALEKLNPSLPAEAIEQAIEELLRNRSALSAGQANREVYQLLRGGVKVRFRAEDGREVEETVRVMDWSEQANNDFLVVRQLWVTGALHRRRPDLVGFVNGIPLVLIELKAHTKQLENAFSRQVHLKSGGYIVIDETEALVAIDVNTGRHKGGKDQETSILKVNLEAADEISRQLRLRNMGGLIVLDFIDMKSRRDQQNVYQRMKDGLRRDKAKTHILPISQLGLMEMTRQRHSESVRAAVYDDCPYCKGRGKVKSSLTMSVEIQRKLQEILKKRTRDENDFQLRIVVHPTVLERLRTEDEKHLIEMEKRYFGKLSFRADPGMHAEQFKIYNAATNEELVSVGG